MACVAYSAICAACAHLTFSWARKPQALPFAVLEGDRYTIENMNVKIDRKGSAIQNETAVTQNWGMKSLTWQAVYARSDVLHLTFRYASPNLAILQE